MTRKKTAGELRAENRLLRKFRLTEGVASVLNRGISWVGVVLVARYAYLAIAALAGQQTAAEIGINFLGEVRVSEALAWLFGAGGVAYGMGQRKVRRDTIERSADRIRSLEQRLDPSRSSSRLTPRGTTRPEDKT